ncbi:MAG: STAS domain-containing protein [Candidatus Roseilinea sp.]|uniref:STAS domain-containing protein n=1 Tax=Candidatus Roseilinea sp. TaxID=2838777 RepID=UPI0040497B76
MTPASLVVRESVEGATEDPSASPVHLVQAAGRLDASTVSILEHALMRALRTTAKVIILDLSEVTYISSSGLRVLLTARRQLRDRRGQLILCALSQNVRDVFDMVGFTVLFEVVDSLDHARQIAARYSSAAP